MPYLNVRDIDICFDRAGAGAPLLTISGSRGDLRRKPNLLESPLAKTFDVLAYDQRGLGRTSKPNKAYSMADYADDATALLDAVGWERVRVVGVSFGGMASLELVLRHPGRVTKLVFRFAVWFRGLGVLGLDQFSMLRATPAVRLMRPARSRVSTICARWVARLRVPLHVGFRGRWRDTAVGVDEARY